MIRRPRLARIGMLCLACLATAHPSCRAGAAAPRPATLILPFDVGSAEAGDPLGGLLADLLGQRLAAVATLVDREALPKVLAEQELTLKGLADPGRAARVGKLLGAEFLVAGRVFRLGDATVASARVISVATGRFKGANVSLPGDPAPDALAGRAADALAGAFPRLAAELSRPEGGAQARDQPEAEAPAATVAVLNFANRADGDPSRDWLSKGLADLLIGDLAGQGLRVVSREQMQELVHELEIRQDREEAARDPQGPPRPPRPAPDPRGVARVLKAARCVQGTYRADGGRVELGATVIEVEGGRLVHAATRSGPEGELLALEKALAAELVEVLAGRRPGTVDPATLPRWTESLKASELLYGGIDLFDRGRYLDAWAHFRRALRQDPRYADAVYWAGRMMYYEQEYHQARVDLERFAAEHPEHPRAGDAVMELISAAQLTAADAAEVLEFLAFAAELAPGAEVPNQFGPGLNSTVGLYTAGLAAQILRTQGRYGAAFDRFAAQIGRFPPDRPHYGLAWDELAALRIEHLKATGELLTLPPAPEPPPPQSPLNWPYSQYFGGRGRGPLVPVAHEFTRFTPEQPSVTMDFAEAPITFMAPTRHFAADPGHYLEALEIEFRHHLDPRTTCVVRVKGDVAAGIPLDASGVSRQVLKLPPGTRAVGMDLMLFSQPRGNERVDKPTTAITAWKVTARLRPFEGAPATVVLRAPDDLMFRAKIDGVERPPSLGPMTLPHVPPGAHTLRVAPGARGPYRAEEVPFRVGPGATLELPVAAAPGEEADRPGGPGSPHRVRRISTPYEPFRSGAVLGDQVGKVPGDVRFFEDRSGRWVILWCMRRNLYLTTSADRGETWTPTVLLPTPVNSAHDERMPSLSQDMQGRYLLAFSSDRNLAHAHAVYACWSDDLVNFSAPVLVAPDPGLPLRILQRSDGTYLAYAYLLGRQPGVATEPRPLQRGGPFPTGADRWAVCTSTDLIHWSSPRAILAYAEFPESTRAALLAKPAAALDVVEDRGRFVALAHFEPMYARTPEEQRSYLPPRSLYVQSSDDGIHFTAPAPAGPLTLPWVYQPPQQIACRRVADRLMAIPVSQSGCGAILRRGEDGPWPRVAALDGSFDLDLRAAGLGGSVEGLLWGDYALTEDTLCFFGTPPSIPARDRRADTSGWLSPEEPAWLRAGQPLFMVRHRYVPEPAGPEELRRVDLFLQLSQAAIAPDGRRALIGDFTTVSLWDLEGDAPGPLLQMPAANLQLFAFSPDGRRAVIGGGSDLFGKRGATLQTWDLDARKLVGRFEGPATAYHGFAIAPDGRRALTGDGPKPVAGGKPEPIDGALSEWDLEGGRQLRRFGKLDGQVTGVAFAPDGRVALWGADRTLRFLDVATGAEEGRINGLAAPTWRLAFTPDGRRLLTSGGDRVLRLWDVAGGRQLRAFEGHESVINSLAIAPDGRRALSSSQDGTARLWDLESGRELRRYEARGKPVLAAAFAPDGRRAVTIGGDGTARWWRLPE